MLFLANSGGGKSSSSGSSGGSFFSSAPKKDPVDLAKEWKRNLQKEMRNIDRDILNIKRQEDRALKECKALVKKNHVSAAKILAKEVANTRKTITRMYTAKAQLNSVSNQLQTSVCKYYYFLSSFFSLCKFVISFTWLLISVGEDARLYVKKYRNYASNE